MYILIIDFIEPSTNNIIKYFIDKGLQIIRLTKNLFDRKYIENKNIVGVVCTGSEQNITDKGHDLIPEFVFKLNVPILCICYSAQLIAERYGSVFVIGEMKGLHKLDNDTTVWTNYTVGITDVDNCIVLNKFKDTNLIACFKKDKIFCVIFHPERSKDNNSLYNIEYLDSFYEFIYIVKHH
jgi:anthranilate/para-aminobenzoate synthase component II